MHKGLPLLGVEGPLRFGLHQRSLGVVGDIPSGTILADGDTLPDLVVKIIDRTLHIGLVLLIIPSGIFVQSDLVGDQVDIAVWATGSGDHDPVRIDLLGNFLHVCQLRPAGRHGVKLEFVEDSPPDNAGMIVELVDQLAKLFLTVHPEGSSGAGSIDQRDLVPEQDSGLVVDLMPMLTLRIVGISDSRYPHLLHHSCISLLILGRDRPTFATDILMAANPIDSIRLPIKQKTLVL